ncbi:DnaJ domain-containing protein [Amycolatopsis sp. ATCC 39116]|uniref:J domain-containing protein n=1 Tax=Amycolatopsis sp. (strain ATCC 39116 / 75iv2) TaxID=385957 RepID=UPI0002625AC9|nr:DnaJ domain-containing protein [Amycolatopsis sp. ATCC 39116]
MRGEGYYDLLGVDRRASTSEIKSAYRQRARTAHPDAGGSPDEFQALRQAYEVLVDPLQRAAYDRALDRAAATSSPVRARRPGRKLGEDPSFTAELPVLDPNALEWWDAAREKARTGDRAAPGHAPAALLLAWLLLVVLPIMAGALAVAVWLVLASAVAIWLVRQHREMARAERAVDDEFGGTVVFGAPGAEPDQWGERLTAELLERYLTRLPGARIFHGLAWPGSVFADIDHAVLAGRRLVLIESKTWLPGHYAADEYGELWRDNRRFRGGATQLPEALDAFRALLPGAEIRGALIVYPSRTGEITTDEDFDVPAPPMTPDQFVQVIGDWLAAEPARVDVRLLRKVRAQVV